MKSINKENLREIFQHASLCYPKECCGFVLLNGSVYKGVNIQDELHTRRPDIYPRTSNTGYTFSVSDTIFLNDSFRTQNPVTIIYHSHPDVGAYFSNEDISKAMYEGQPLYPVTYLVIDVRKNIVLSAKLFQWHDGKFICIEEFQNIDIASI